MKNSHTLKETSREFDTILADIVEYLKVTYPDKWNDFLAANAGAPILDAVAFAFSVLSWNLDKVSSETNLNSAELRKSVLRFAEMFVYKPSGRSASIVLCDATVSGNYDSSSDVLIPKTARLKSAENIIFEVMEDTIIKAGDTTPKKIVANIENTFPTGLLVDFTAGSEVVTLNLGDIAGRHSFAIYPGMYIRSLGQFKDWYRIASINDDYSKISLTRQWNASFDKPFIVKTLGNDSVSSAIITASSPFGSFPSNAVVQLGQRVVNFRKPLPNTVVVGHWFRLNDINRCHFNKFYKIIYIDPERKFLRIEADFGPLEDGGFDDINVRYEVESRSVILIQGETRTDEFVSDGTAFQSFSLLAGNIVGGSLEVYDEDGVTDTESEPLKWEEINSVAFAVGSRYRSYQSTLEDGDSYTIRFGNGISGKIPSGRINVRYKVGGGEVGNIPRNSINALIAAQQGINNMSLSLSNPDTAGFGGRESESVEEMKLNIGAYNATNLRAVTPDDYIALLITAYPKYSQSLGKVFRATVESAGGAVTAGNVIYLYCWTLGSWSPPETSRVYSKYIPVAGDMISSLQTFIEQYAVLNDKPFVVKGRNDEVILEADLKIDPMADRNVIKGQFESAVVDLINGSSDTLGNPVLLGDIYRVTQSIKGLNQMRLRKMYIDYRDPEESSDLSDTPLSLQTVGDLYPRGSNSILSPGSISLDIWTQEIGVDVYISGETYSNASLGEEGVRKALNMFFQSLRPGDGFTQAQLTGVVEEAVAWEVNEMASTNVATSANIDVFNSNDSSQLIVDGVTLTHGMRILVKNQTSARENGVYLFQYDQQFWRLDRSEDANSFLKLSPGSVIEITGGVSNAGTFWFYNTHNLTASTFVNGDKAFSEGDKDAAKVSVRSFSTLSSVKLDSPVGATPNEKAGVVDSVYCLKGLSISGL